MTKTNSTLEAMLAQYEKSSAPTYNNANTEKFDLKNYFTTFLPEKEKSATKIIRVLPTADGSSPFVEIFGHKVQINGEWKTFICLKHAKGEDCPFCEARDLLLATGKETDKETAKKYSARKMYAPKIIERDDEAHGPKFWRFNHDYRKQGVLDKIFSILQALKKDITDPEIGRDLMISIARDQNGRPFVQGITPLDPSPLSEDKELAKKWLEDEKTWESVYSIKPYDYLEIIVKGGEPVWDKEEKKYVDKGSVSKTETEKLDAELALGVSNVKPNITVATSATAPQTSATTEDEDDDLPF